MANPLVSIVTPSLNQAQFIEETILSVEGQDYPNIEHIIIDGGSTDGTIEILKHYENKYNLIWISEQDKGQSDAINRGFQLAKGEIVGWLNSDDTYMPGSVSIAMEHFTEHPDVGWIYGDGYWIDEDSRVLAHFSSMPFDLKRMAFKKLTIVQPTLFFKSKLLEKIGYLDMSLRYTMDTDFFIRLGIESPAGYVPEALATRRLHEHAKSVSDRVHFRSDWIKTLQKLFARQDLSEEITRLKSDVFGKAFYEAGCGFFDVGENSKASEYLYKAIVTGLNPLRTYKAKSLAILFQCYLHLRWYVPGQGSNLCKFQLAGKNISLKWTETNEAINSPTGMEP